MRTTLPSRVAGLGAALAALGVLAACAEVQRTGVDVERALRGPVTTWTGGLHCTEGFGDARVDLTLAGDVGHVDAVLAYEVDEPLTRLPPGRMRMEGRVDGDGTLELHGTHWIDWPEGQRLFGLTGTLDPKRGTLSGTVPECGAGSTLYLERVTGSPPNL